MHVRVAIGPFQPGKIDQGVSIYGDSVAPATKQLKGCQGATFLVDRSTGKGMSLTFWETEADMAAGEASGHYREQVAKMVPTLAAPPATEHYEVAVQK